MITGDQVKAAMIAADIKRVEHHECSLCGYPTAYLREGDELAFDRGCDCVTFGYVIEPRSWDSAADWINMQDNDGVRTKLAAKFGIT